jgi:hypothetical protein
MREIKAQFELSEKAITVDRRYWISLGDGIHTTSFTLGPKDQFSRPEWEFLVGPSVLSGSWHSNNSEGMYVHICRQYLNPNFDFTPEAYQRQGWLIDDPQVSEFRLYNPFLARPCLDWSTKNGWGNSIAFSEGDQQQFAWSYSEWETKIEEKDVQYTVKRLNDSDDYKEFLIRLD